MTPETYEMLEQIAYRYWNNILNYDAGLNGGFSDHINKGADSPFQQTVPEEKRKEWVQAMNAMSAYGVFEFSMEEDFDLDDPLNPCPTGEINYSVLNFNKRRFIDFCTEFKIDLQRDPNKHYAMLNIGSDNVPIVTIKNKRYAFNKISPSTFLNIMKIATNSPNERLNINKLNQKGSDPDIVSSVLGGKKMSVSNKKDGLFRGYIRNLETFPKELLVFFEEEFDAIKYILPKELDDKQLKELLKNAHEM